MLSFVFTRSDCHMAIITQSHWINIDHVQLCMIMVDGVLSIVLINIFSNSKLTDWLILLFHSARHFFLKLEPIKLYVSMKTWHAPVFQSGMGAISWLAWKGDYLVFGDADGQLCLWDLKAKQARYAPLKCLGSIWVIVVEHARYASLIDISTTLLFVGPSKMTSSPS